MIVRTVRPLVIIAGVLALALVGTGAWAQTPPAPQGTSAGQTAAGEPCVFRPIAADTGMGAQASYEILCGKTGVLAATLHQTAGTTGADALRALAASGRWRSVLDGRARCEAPTQTSLGGNPAVVIPCMRAGGVPYIGVLSTAGGKTFLADGISPSAPAIEATIAALAGSQPGAAGAARGGGTITGQLDARFKGGFGSGDIDKYQGLMRVGGRQNIEENYAKAEESFREALVLHQKLFGRDNPDQADALVHFALQISNQRRFSEADPLFDRAERFSGGVKDPLVRARVVHYYAQHLANQGKLEEAKRKIDLAEAAYIAAAPGLAPMLNHEPDRRTAAIGFGVRGQRFVDPRGAASAVPTSIGVSPITQLAAQGEAEILRLRAILALSTGDNAGSRTYATKAISLLEQVGIDPGGVRWRAVRIAGLGAARQDQLGAASADLGDSARGLNQALPSSQPAGKTFLESGNIQLKRGNVAGALSEFRRGAAILHERQNTVSVETAMPYLDAAYRQSQTGATGGVSLHAEMLDAAQLITSGVTASFVAQAALRLGDGNERVRALQDLTNRVTDLYQRRDIAANRNADAATLASIDAQIGETQTQRAAAEEEVRKNLPNYFQLVAGQANSKDVLDVLRPQEGFLQVVLGARQGYAMLAQNGRVNAWPVDLSLDKAEEIVAKLRGAFMPDAQGQLPKFDVALAHDLFRRVLGPGQQHLKPLKALIITTNGALQSLPFNLMVASPPPAINEYVDYKKVEWLAKWFAMSYVPAPQSLVLLRKQAAFSRAPNAYIGFGGFQPLSVGVASTLVAASRSSTLTQGQRCDADARELAALPVLPLAEGEVALTAKQLGVGPAGTRLGRAFTRTSVLKGQLDRYKIIHLAAHALLPSELRCLQQPVIMTGQGSGPEAMITASDLASIKLDANMVILSACNTAGPDGKSAGEAFSGLARAFFTAGTRGLMASHWSVADESTTLMMINVLAAVGKGGSAATVLRNAQLEMLDGAGKNQDPAEWAHPFFWAPFVFAGNTSVPQS